METAHLSDPFHLGIGRDRMCTEPAPGIDSRHVLRLSFIIAYLNAKQIATVHNSLDRMEQILQTYSELIKCIEGENFQSAELADIHNRFASDGQTASSIIKKLSGHIGALNQRFSAIGVILNIFTLRDTRMLIKLEKWKMEQERIRNAGSKHWLCSMLTVRWVDLPSITRNTFNLR